MSISFYFYSGRADTLARKFQEIVDAYVDGLAEFDKARAAGPAAMSHHMGWRMEDLAERACYAALSEQCLDLATRETLDDGEWLVTLYGICQDRLRNATSRGRSTSLSANTVSDLELQFWLALSAAFSTETAAQYWTRRLEVEVAQRAADEATRLQRRAEVEAAEVAEAEARREARRQRREARRASK